MSYLIWINFQLEHIQKPFALLSSTVPFLYLTPYIRSREVRGWRTREEGKPSFGVPICRSAFTNLSVLSDDQERGLGPGTYNPAVPGAAF